MKRCILALAYTIFAMGFVLILPHVEPLFRSLSIGQISFTEFWQMWVLLYPMIFYLQMPLIVAFSIGLVYLLLARDKELTVALASGASPLRIAWPGVIAAMFGAGLCALMSLYLLPITILKFKDMAYVASKRVSSKSLESGEFNNIHGGYTLYFKSSGRDGRMNDVILKDNSNRKSDTIVTAKSAKLQFGKVDISLVLYDGIIQKPGDKKRAISFVGFKILHYPIGKVFQYNSLAGRQWGYFERSISTLLDPPDTLKLSKRQKAEWKMEGNKRIINPIMCLGYGILIIGMIGWINTRVRNVYWVIPFALVAIFGIHGFYIVFLSAYVKYASDLPEVLYGVPIAVFFDGFFLLYLLMREKKPRKVDRHRIPKEARQTAAV